jgi:flagellar biosynthesis protein FliR
VHLDVSFLPAIGAAFLLIFARTGTMVMLLPGLGEQNISPRLRLTIALVLAAVLLPLHRPAYHIDTSALGPTIVLLVEEIMIGAVLGLTARLTISAGSGRLGDRPAIGLGFVTTIDPTGRAGRDHRQFLTMLGITLFFATDALPGHTRSAPATTCSSQPGARRRRRRGAGHQDRRRRFASYPALAPFLALGLCSISGLACCRG